MHDTVAQPNASRIPESLVGEVVRSALGSRAETPSFTAVHYDHFSNDLVEARLDDGRSVIVKRGRYPWAAERFQTSRMAAGLLRSQTGIVAPVSLELPGDRCADPLDAYWRIDLPTLSEVWPDLPQGARREAVRSLGRLIARVHRIRLPGHGALPAAAARSAPLSQFLAEDLGGRLMPAVSAQWPEGVELVEFLLEMIPEASRRGGAGGVLLHGDLHFGNVLCEREADEVRCVGLLDLECAHAGPRESDLARLSVLHTELFNMAVEGPWLEWAMEGYGSAVDPVLFGFYAVYHLVQMGYYSASIDHAFHAEQVATAAGSAVAALRRRGWSSAVVAEAVVT